MLRSRLISASVLISIVLVCLVLDYYSVAQLSGGVWLLPLLIFFCFGTAREMSRMIAQSGRPIHGRLAVAGAVTTTLIATIPMLWEAVGQEYPVNCPVGRVGWVVIGLLLGLGLALVAEMSTFAGAGGGAVDRVAWSVLVTTYVGVPLAMLVITRDLGLEGSWGMAALVSLIAVTKSSDAGAYFTGKALGRHKLIPRLSPGKTWEGALGGVLCSIAVSFACFYGLFPWLGGELSAPPPWWGPIAFGFVCAVAGMLGDLAESLFKRELGVKDSGNMLPGLGGIWDVTDSLIGAALPGFLVLAAGGAGAIP